MYFFQVFFDFFIYFVQFDEYFYLIPSFNAFFGHALTHFPQRIHSAESGVFTGSTSIGQTCVHLPQCIHFPIFTSIRKRLTLFKSPQIAPSGHITLQKNLQILKHPTSVITRITIFTENNVPITRRSSGCVKRSGIPPSSVPTGQIYSQNAGTPKIPAFFHSQELISFFRTHDDLVLVSSYYNV